MPPSGKPAGSDPARVPLVFLDGIGCDGYVWKYLARDLALHHPIVHLHYRGHGGSPAPADRTRVTIEDLADDVDQMMTAAFGDRNLGAVLCGHSMGVQVALETARRHPERARGLGLMCGSYGHPLRTFHGQRTLEQILPLLQFVVGRVPGIASAIWQTLLPTEMAFEIATRLEINGELVRRRDFYPYLEHMARIDVRLFVDMLAAAGKHTAKEFLPTIDLPTLIVGGERDNFTPASLAKEMHALIVDSEIMIVEDGSHTAPIERPREVNAQVADFLARHFDLAAAAAAETR